MTNELDFRINARLNEGQMEWYKKFAKLNKVKISELLRLIPDLYDKLDSEVDELSGKVNDLSNEINPTQKKLKKSAGDIDSQLLQIVEKNEGSDNEDVGYRRFKDMFNVDNSP